jgi:hypothetical protein
VGITASTTLFDPAVGPTSNADAPSTKLVIRASAVVTAKYANATKTKHSERDEAWAILWTDFIFGCQRIAGSVCLNAYSAETLMRARHLDNQYFGLFG